MSLKVRWVTWYPMQVGSSFGYSIHNDKTQDALERMGVLDSSSKIGVYVAPPHLFHVLPELEKHYLYCAWETSTLPPLMIERVRAADGVFVVSKFLTVPFGAIRPTKVAHLGVDDCFSYVKRYRPARGKPFRWLWCGAPNARKGWQIMVTVCDRLQELRRDYNVPPFELYLKTSKPGESFVKRVGEHMIYDCRKLPVNELVRLYHEAHAFCMPSFGEGFGLTPAEATRTGLPCLYTPGTGMDDFLEGHGYPIKVKIEPLFDWFAGPAHDRENYPHHFGPATVPQPQSMGELMVEVMVNYERAVKRAKRAARRIAAEFTWDNTARAIMNGLEEWIDGKH